MIGERVHGLRLKRNLVPPLSRPESFSIGFSHSPPPRLSPLSIGCFHLYKLSVRAERPIYWLWRCHSFCWLLGGSRDSVCVQCRAFGQSGSGERGRCPVLRELLEVGWAHRASQSSPRPSTPGGLLFSGPPELAVFPWHVPSRASGLWRPQLRGLCSPEGPGPMKQRSAVSPVFWGFVANVAQKRLPGITKRTSASHLYPRFNGYPTI